MDKRQNMKIAFGMIVLNGNYVLKEVLESVYPFASQIVIAEGPVRYWQQKGLSISNDGTNDILDNFPDPLAKIHVIHSQYNEKDEQCNAYIPHINDDIDYLWNLDSDEVFKPEDIERIIQLLHDEKYTSVGFKSCTFFGGFDHIMGGFEEQAEFLRIRKFYPGSFWATHRPPTLSHKVKNTLPEKHLNFNKLYDDFGVRMYHYSYTFPKQVYEKLKYYRESLNTYNCHDNYFDNIYLPWVLGNDIEKEKIENKYNGVHEFKNRIHARTRKFEGNHPKIILDNMDKLTNLFHEQLSYFRSK